MLKKVKAQILLNFDRNHPTLFGTGENLPKDSGENISVKYLPKSVGLGHESFTLLKPIGGRSASTA